MIEICGRKIGVDHPPYFVAEIGSNHDGDIERAKKLIHLAAEANADAVKFQYFSPETLVSERDTSVETLALLQSLTVPSSWTPALALAAHASGVSFIATPFDLGRADELEPYVDAYKIASGDLTYHNLIKHVTKKKKPLFLATGASTASDVDDAIGAYLDACSPTEYGQNLVLMQCIANYSGSSEGLQHMNLRVLRYWQNNYYVTPGLSDHTPGWVAVNAAVALGACVVEKHFTDDRTREGPDHPFALEPKQWRRMIDEAKATWSTLGDEEKRVADNEDAVPIRRALRYSKDLPREGHLKREDFVALRPCPKGALEPYRLDEVVGRRLKRDVHADATVRLEDLE